MTEARATVRTAKAWVRGMLPPAVLRWRLARYARRAGERELAFVRHLCGAGRDAIDIGANVGVYTQEMLRHAAAVHAFEAVPALAAELKRKFGSAVHVHGIALSDRQGTADLSVPVVDGEVSPGLASLMPARATAFPTIRTIQVPVATLDSAYAGDAAFIKIDVEGHEEAVLTGARQTLLRCRPALLIEIEERHAPGSIGRVIAMLAPLGYAGFFREGRQIRPIESFQAHVHQDPGRAPPMSNSTNIHDYDDYVNNFVFLPHDAADRLVRALRTQLAAA